MKIKQILTLLTAGILYLGCNNAGEKTEKSYSDSTAQEKETEPKKEVLELNQGAKWIVNEEMKPHILASENAFLDYKSTKDQDYKTLAGVLKEHTDKLIASCSMKGESHEQLHLWLLPHLALIKELSTAPSQTEADAVLNKLDASFKTYHTYFQ
ncbi:MAG TPA: hypothetical protein DIW47_14445 [Bacteroidetes bacterium]|nr:hypothetical protein [Bacteroidota bacterium]